MKIVYISFPEYDMLEDEKARRQEELLETAGEYLHEPVEAVRKYDAEAEHSELEELGESLKRMNKADYVMLSGDWRQERRTRIEMACALEYEKKILLEYEEKIEEAT